KQSAGIGHGRRIARTKTAVNIFKSLFLVVRRILSKRLHDCVIVRNVDDLGLLNVQRHDLPDSRQSQGLKSARDRHLTIADICGEHFAGELFFVEFVAQLQGLDVVKKFDDLLVRTISECAKESRREEFPTALASVEINVKQVSRIKLLLDPRPAVWN